MEITIWSDLACPFCYLGETMLESVIDDLRQENNAAVADVTVVLKAYELDPKAPAQPVETMEQHFVTSHGITVEGARKQMELITKMGKRVGLDFHLAEAKVCNTFDAHRLLKYAAAEYGRDVALRLSFALFKAEFVQEKLLSDHQVLLETAIGAGLERDGVQRILDGNDYGKEVRADEEEAEKLDLEYIPYMLFPDGTVLQGPMTKGELRSAIEKSL